MHVFWEEVGSYGKEETLRMEIYISKSVKLLSLHGKLFRLC